MYSIIEHVWVLDGVLSFNVSAAHNFQAGSLPLATSVVLLVEFSRLSMWYEEGVCGLLII